ncbi:MAG: putative protein conserved in bacteria (DUF2147) [Rhodobacteraceae bacterium HLUCCA12]|nr:MAG: putative protein conserved in bacteria (DUF2147) [Rhodobacteraceae bacterium HLUCCA12]
MKRLILTAAAAVALALPALAEPVLGHWRTAPDDNGNTGIVEIVACEDRVCGTLIEAFDGNGQAMSSPNVGRRIIWDMEPDGNGRYRNGRVWAPDRDQTYNARMQMEGERLTVSGCVLVFCRDAIWTRAR